MHKYDTASFPSIIHELIYGIIVWWAYSSQIFSFCALSITPLVERVIVPVTKNH